MLLEGSINIAAIAVKLGFYDSAHFTRSFKKVLNVTPSEYKTQMLDEMKGLSSF